MLRLSAIVAIFCLGLLIVSCGVQNPAQPQFDNTAQLLFSEDKIPQENGQYLYLQHIEVINPTAGSLFSYQLETYNNELPENMFANEEGWLYYYANGSDTSVPLSEPGNHRSLWTSQSSLIAQFGSAEGKIQNLITHIVIRQKSPEGIITEISSPFKSSRIVGSRIVFPNTYGSECGTGMEFVLQETIGDIYVEGLYAHHFMYRLNILNAQLQVISSGNWFSSIDTPDIRKIVLNGSTTPALGANQPDQYTQFETYVVARNGIEEATHQTTYFRCVTGYKPVALIYSQTVAGMGLHHYTITQDDPMTSRELIPSLTGHKNRRLFTVGNSLEAIYSDDFKLHIRWGYKGQYGVIGNETPIVTNSPWDNELNTVLSPANVNYRSAIAAFDLSFDSNPFPVMPYFVNPTVVMHQNGSTWLRVNNLNDSARKHIFSNLSSGTHVFQVCAVDLQGAISDPASVSINLIPYKPFNQRSGILVVDDSPPNTSQSPETIVDDFYNSVVPTTFGTVAAFDIDAGGGNTNYISPTLMQNYKAVVWHSDNPGATGKLNQNVDALELYLSGGGRLLLSGTAKLFSVFSEIASYQDFLYNRLGINSMADMGILSSTLSTNPFFISAIGQNGLPDIPLNLSSAFNTIVASRQGLSSISYFNPEANLNFLYKFGCKPVSATAYPPTQDQYDLYSSKFVAYKHYTAEARVVVFGFPLSYMQQAEVSSGLQSIFADMLSGSFAKGGRP